MPLAAGSVWANPKCASKAAAKACLAGEPGSEY
jgi:hypothetical protein